MGAITNAVKATNNVKKLSAVMYERSARDWLAARDMCVAACMACIVIGGGCHRNAPSRMALTTRPDMALLGYVAFG